MNNNTKIAKELVKLAKSLVAAEDMDWFKNDYKKIKSSFTQWANKQGFKIDYVSYPESSDNECELFRAEKNSYFYANQKIRASLIFKVIDNEARKYEIIPNACGYSVDGDERIERNSGMIFSRVPTMGELKSVFIHLIGHVDIQLHCVAPSKDA